MYQLPRWSNQANVIENSDSTQQYRFSVEVDLQLAYKFESTETQSQPCRMENVGFRQGYTLIPDLKSVFSPSDGTSPKQQSSEMTDLILPSLRK